MILVVVVLAVVVGVYVLKEGDTDDFGGEKR